MNKELINKILQKNNVIFFFLFLIGINVISALLKQYKIANNILFFSIFSSASYLLLVSTLSLREFIANKSSKTFFKVCYNIVFFITLMIIIDEGVKKEYYKSYYREISDSLFNTYITSQVLLFIFFFIPFLYSLLIKIKSSIKDKNTTNGMLLGDKIIIIGLIIFGIIFLLTYAGSK